MGHNTNLLTNLGFLILPMFQFFSLPDYAFDEIHVPPWAYDRTRYFASCRSGVVVSSSTGQRAASASASLRTTHPAEEVPSGDVLSAEASAPPAEKCQQAASTYIGPHSDLSGSQKRTLVQNATLATPATHSPAAASKEAKGIARSRSEGWKGASKAQRWRWAEEALGGRRAGLLVESQASEPQKATKLEVPMNEQSMQIPEQFSATIQASEACSLRWVADE